MLVKLCKLIKKIMKARWGKCINRFINKCQQSNFNKMQQLKKSEDEKNWGRRYIKICKVNSAYNFILKDGYSLNVSIICKSPKNNSILKKRSK